TTPTNATLVIGTEGTNVLTGIKHVSLTGTPFADVIDASGFTGGSVILASGGGADTLKGTQSFTDTFSVDASNLNAATDHVTVNTGASAGDHAEIHGLSSVTQSDVSLITYQGTPATPTLNDGNINTNLYTGGESI